MIVAGIFFAVSCLLFAVSMFAIITMLKEFAILKASSIIMENAFKEQMESSDGFKSFITRGLEATDAQFKETEDHHQKLLSLHRSISERLNKIESEMKDPISPDITFN